MAKSVRPASWLKQLALGAGALGTMIFTAQHIRPVYAGRAPVVRELFEPRIWGDSALSRAPWVTDSADVALTSPQFEIDRRAFMEDLIRTAAITPGRADSVATFAVREAYRRRVPPALVFGVLMVENRDLKSSATSNAGAVDEFARIDDPTRDRRSRHGQRAPEISVRGRRAHAPGRIGRRG